MHELTEKLWAIEPWRKIKINKIITDWLGDKAIELACTYPKKLSTEEERKHIVKSSASQRLMRYRRRKI